MSSKGRVSATMAAPWASVIVEGQPPWSPTAAASTIVRRKGAGPPGTTIVGRPAPVVAAPQRIQAVTPPGWFDPRAAQVQGPRRFPGHFMPHRLCNHFTAHGWCRKAEACTFAHGVQELHPDVQVQMMPRLGYPVMPVLKGHPKGKGKGGMVYVTGPELAPISPEYLDRFVSQEAELVGDGVLCYRGVAGGSTGELDPNAAPFEMGGAGSQFEFNIGAAEFVPTAQDDDDAEEGEEGDGSSPSRHRPAPLSLDDSPMVVSSGGPATLMPQAAPAAASEQVGRRGVQTTGVAKVVATSLRHSTPPRRIPSSPTAGDWLLATPKTLLASPNGSSLITRVLASPTTPSARYGTPGQVVPMTLQSPVRSSNVLLRSPNAVVWPSTPTLMLSPKAPSTPVPISRATFLEARVLAQRLEQGPPGLGHCAPTPTTKANNFGFRYPQPGWLVARPARA